MNRLLQNIKSKLFRKSMYPELEKAGGLSNALNHEFEKLNSILRTSINADEDKLPIAYSRVESGNKFSQIYIVAERKHYLPDFWRDGVCLAHGSTDNISELILAVDYWLTSNVSTHALAEKFNFVTPSDKASAFDENREVEYAWKHLLSDKYNLELGEFISLAVTDDALNKLFPFTSLYTLCFSKCTGYPFDTKDLPNVTPIEYFHFAAPWNTVEEAKSKPYNSPGNGKIYIVTKNKTQYLGKGNAAETLRIVLKNLPNDIEAARKGTAEG